MIKIASFKKRGKTWQYTIELGIDPQTGKRKQKTKSGFKTKKDAKEAAAELESNTFHGFSKLDPRIVFRDYEKHWMRKYKRLVKPPTIDSRNTALKHIRMYLNLYPIQDIDKDRYANMLYSLHDKGYAPNTIKSIHSTARIIFKSAKDDNLITVDPTENIDFRFLRKKQILDEEDIFEEGNFLEKEELVIFLNISKKQKFPQDFPIFSTLAYSGLRRGELCVLKWDDINFIEKTISITKTYYNKKGKIDEFDIIPPKTKSSKRIIDIDDFLVNVLRKLKAWQNEYILANGKNYTNFNFVFINTNMYPGYPLHPNYIYQHMLKITKKMELTKTLSPHSLRHTHASLYIEAGVELRDIAERLGHDNLDTLQKIYAHTTRGQKKKTAEKFSQLMTKVLEQTSL